MTGDCPETDAGELGGDEVCGSSAATSPSSAQQERPQPRVQEGFAEFVEQFLLVNGLPLLRRILDQGSPLIEAGLLDPDGLKTTVTGLETGTYVEDPWSKLVEVITLHQTTRAFLP